ncbi:MAG: NIPSNAP family protein [Planctomycetota bacterium]
MRTLCTALCAALVAMSIASSFAAAAEKATAGGDSSGKVYELRTYIAPPGKLDALNARFRDHTCALFKKHGIEVVGFWVPAEGDEAQNTLIYLLVFPSVEAQKAAWAAFRADPDWQKARTESEKEGKLTEKVISQNLKATDYSPMK